MTEPTTAAEFLPTVDRDIIAEHDRIAAAEAVATALARVRARVEKAEPKYDPMRAPEWYFDGWYEAQDAVLAIINEEAGP